MEATLESLSTAQYWMLCHHIIITHRHFLNKLHECDSSISKLKNESLFYCIFYTMITWNASIVAQIQCLWRLSRILISLLSRISCISCAVDTLSMSAQGVSAYEKPRADKAEITVALSQLEARQKKKIYKKVCSSNSLLAKGVKARIYLFLSQTVMSQRHSWTPDGLGCSCHVYICACINIFIIIMIRHEEWNLIIMLHCKSFFFFKFALQISASMKYGINLIWYLDHNYLQ